MHDYSLDSLFRSSYKDLQRFFRGRTGSSELAADLAQETFLRMLRPHQDTRNPRAYLFRIARNVLIDHYRSAAHTRRAELEDSEWEALPDTTPSQEQVVLSAEELAVLKDAVATLPPRGREVFELSKFQELDYDEIAAQLGISRNTVMVHLARAMVHCKKHLDEYHRQQDAGNA